MAERSFYAVLGVSKDASEAEIRAAYRRNAIREHPDKNPGDRGAEERFKELTQAYEVLSDPKRRAQYDRRLEGGSGREAVNLEDLLGGLGGFSIEDILRRHGDLFGEFGVPFRTGRMERRGSDLEAELRVDFLTAARGGVVDVQLANPAVAPGTRRQVKVRIPHGVRDGAMLRLAGLGHQGMRGGPPGDLLLRIRIAAHPTFRREDDDVWTEVRVPAPIAVLGGDAAVDTLDGTATVRIPPGTTGGRILRLRGQGIRGGDLLARVVITVPVNPSTEERTHYAALRDLTRT